MFNRFHRMLAMLQVCDLSFNKHLIDNIHLEEEYTSDIINMFRFLAPTFNETMFLCKFRNDFQPCHDMFREVITDEGLCFTFNMLNSQELYRDT